MRVSWFHDQFCFHQQTNNSSRPIGGSIKWRINIDDLIIRRLSITTDEPLCSCNLPCPQTPRQSQSSPVDPTRPSRSSRPQDNPVSTKMSRPRVPANPAVPDDAGYIVIPSPPPVALYRTAATRKAAPRNAVPLADSASNQNAVGSSKVSGRQKDPDYIPGGGRLRGSVKRQTRGQSGPYNRESGRELSCQPVRVRSCIADQLSSS